MRFFCCQIYDAFMSPNVVLIIVNSAEAEVMQPKVPVQVVFGIKMIKNQTVPLQLFV